MPLVVLVHVCVCACVCVCVINGYHSLDDQSSCYCSQRSVTHVQGNCYHGDLVPPYPGTTSLVNHYPKV